jgi:neutral ceramidase
MKQTILLWAVVLAGFFRHDLAAGQPGRPKGPFRAGASVVDLTPVKYPVPVNGGMIPRWATSAHDPLQARCLVLDDGQTQIGVVVCDSCMIPREVVDAIRQKAASKTGIPADHLVIAATHTHSSVCLTPTFQDLPDSEYMAFFIDRVVEGIERAVAQREPARVGWAVGFNGRQVFNRRWFMRLGFELRDPFGLGTDRVRTNPPVAHSKLLRPAGPVDPEIPILAVQSPDGRPVAVLANYALHYVGGVPDQTLSSDYFGAFARHLARILGAEGLQPPFVAILSNGASGDINNVNFFEGQAPRKPLEQMELVAEDVARSVVAAYRRVEYVDWAPLAVAEAELELGVRKPRPEELQKARQLLAQSGRPPYRSLEAIYAKETVDLGSYPDRVRMRLQAYRVGDVGIATSPCETFVETGLHVKRESPFPVTFLIALANGYNGYLPPVEHHKLGGYETWRAKSSYLEVQAEPKVRATLVELLRKVAQAP